MSLGIFNVMWAHVGSSGKSCCGASGAQTSGGAGGVHLLFFVTADCSHPPYKFLKVFVWAAMLANVIPADHTTEAPQSVRCVFFFFSNSWIFCFLLTYSVGESLGFFFTCNLSTEIRLNPSHNIFTHVGKQSDDRFYTTKTKGGLLNSSHITWNINSNENTIDNSYQ